MAYQQNWNPKNKMLEKDAIDFLSSQVIEITENAFHMRRHEVPIHFHLLRNPLVKQVDLPFLLSDNIF